MDRRGFITVGAAGVASMTIPLSRSSALAPVADGVGTDAPTLIGGAPAPSSAALAAAALSGPNVYNLREAPYFAAGDGVADDTVAVQQWLNDLSSDGRHDVSKVGIVPPGNYKLTAPVTAPRSDTWSIIGYGRYMSSFFYASANTDVNIIEIGNASENSKAIHIRGISIFSYYQMTSGFALKANRLANSSLVDVTFGGELHGKFTANGLWLNGAHQVFVSQFDCQTNGEGIRVNGIDLQSCSDLYLDQGFSTNNAYCGIRCAGGFGGLYLDQVETLANGLNADGKRGINLLIDNSQPSLAKPGNREIILGPSYIADGVRTQGDYSDYGIYVDDPACDGGSIVCHGFIGSSVIHGVYIKSWNGTFAMGSGRIFNNGQDGVRVEDPRTRVLIGDGVSIDSNKGWGVQSVVGNAVSKITAKFRENNSGDISEWIGYWPAWNPRPEALHGHFTAACEVRWSAVGKAVHFTGHVVITDNKDASGAVIVPLPMPARIGAAQICSGRADEVSGKMLQGVIAGNRLTLVAYDNTYPGQTGERLCFSGTYEAAYTKEKGLVAEPS